MRSSANSRIRWATVIEKVLKMMNAPTKRAIPAKASSAVVRKPSASWMSETSWSACCCPVRTLTVVGETAAIRVRSWAGVTPSCAATTIEFSCPGCPASFWASGRVTSTSVKPPTELTPPNLPRPTTLRSVRGPLPTIRTVSPIAIPLSSAVDFSSATSPSLAGAWPST